MQLGTHAPYGTTCCCEAASTRLMWDFGGVLECISAFCCTIANCFIFVVKDNSQLSSVHCSN